MSDGLFINVEVDDSISGDSAIAAKLEEVCPVDIFSSEGGKVSIVAKNLDECVLCRLCIDATPADTVRVIKRYDGDSVL